MSEPRTADAVDWEGAYRELERQLGDVLVGVAAQMREMSTLRIMGVHFSGEEHVTIVVETSHNAKVRLEVSTGDEVLKEKPWGFSNTLTLPRPAGPYTVRAWARRPDGRRVVTATREVTE